MDRTDKYMTAENLERIGRMTLFNDILFRNVAKDKDVARLFVRLFTGREDLDVVARDTQYSVVPVTGQRGVVMDLHIVDDEGSVFDFEVQDYRELHLALRARWYHSQLDWEHGPESGQEYDRLPQVQVVFIMRYDPFGQGRLLYRVRKEAAPGLVYDDGSHTAFMNVGAADDSALGRLAHDLVQTRAEDMYYDELRKQVRHYKTTKEGRKRMCRELEEMRMEDYDKKARMIAKSLLADGMPIPDVARHTGLGREVVEELAVKKDK